MGMFLLTNVSEIWGLLTFGDDSLALADRSDPLNSGGGGSDVWNAQGFSKPLQTVRGAKPRVVGLLKD
jgi:hypothetical protein